MNAPIHPNLLTAARLPLAPLIVGLMITETMWGMVLAAIFSLLLEVTDIADGAIARRYGVVTKFGKLFDPFADSFCRFSLFLGFYAIGAAELWMILIIFYRDSSISFLRSIAAVNGIVIAARQSGKVKGVVQGVGTQIVLLSLIAHAYAPSISFLEYVPWWTMLIVTLVTAVSFVDYFHGNLPILRSAWAE